MVMVDQSINGIMMAMALDMSSCKPSHESHKPFFSISSAKTSILKFFSSVDLIAKQFMTGLPMTSKP